MKLTHILVLGGLLLKTYAGYADTFTVTTISDTGTGSLREAITNANASTATGTHTIAFNIPASVLAGPFGSKRALIALSSALPAITATNVLIDGLTQTSNGGDTNPGTLGTTTTVGVDGLSVVAVNRPEVEISLAANYDALLPVRASGFTIRGVAIHGGGYANGTAVGADRSLGAAIRFDTNASGFLVTQCIIGSSALSYAYPTDGTQCGVYGISVATTTDGTVSSSSGSGVVGGTLSNSLIGFTGNSGVFVINNGAANSTTAVVKITGCQFDQNGYNVAGGDAITLGGSAGVPVGPVTVSGNLLTAPNSSGVQLEIGSTSATTITDNSMLSCGQGGGNITTSLENSAICYLQRNGSKTSTAADVISKNIIRNSEKSGIVVGYGQKTVQITQNNIYGNGQLSIDLVDNANAYPGGTSSAYYGDGDGVTPNRNNSGVTASSPDGGIDYPIFTSATLSGTTLAVAGYVGTMSGQNTFAGATIELFEAADHSASDTGNKGAIISGDGKSVSHGELGRYLGSVTVSSTGSFSGSLTVSNLTGGNTLTGTAWLSAKGTSEASNLITVVATTPPTAVDLTNAVLQNTAARTDLSVSLQGSTSTSGASITSFTITALPDAASGTLYYNNGSSVVPVKAGLSIPYANRANLSFDPAAGYSGNAVVGYTATDSNSKTSDGNATVTIPINSPPVANNITNATLTTTTNTAISALQGTDSDGTIASFTITSLPATSAGTLYYTPSGGTATAVTKGLVLTYANAGTLSFTAASSYAGQAVFNYTATDNDGGVSAAALYTIPVNTGGTAAANTAPTADNKSQSMAADAGNTSLAALSGADSDGAIAGFTIKTLPGTGTLYFNGAAATVGQQIPANQANLLSYKPNGQVNSSFTYTATDNSGAESLTTNPAVFAITVTAPLPVVLVSFDVRATALDAQLAWVTASELTNDHFEVERSLDGTSFAQIGQVAGQGSKATASSYAFTDGRIGAQVTGAVYYRLRQVDTDGASTYSPVRVVRFAESAAAGALASLYPNPAATATTLDLRPLPAGSYRVRLLDVAGRALREQQLVAGQAHSLDLDALPAGTYLVLVQGSTAAGVPVQQTLRLLKP